MQLFEGRPFVIEDFDIRKPLILADASGGVQLEISFEPADRTFTIQSRFDKGASWSLHVVGSMRGERTESPFAASKFETENHHELANLKPFAVDAFYRYMSDLGLRYGEEFRSVRELSVGQGVSAGRVALSETTARRASEYPLHPVLLDGALHVFSGGRAAVEARGSQLKLPVRFGRILFLRSPGASVRVRASVLECNPEFVDGRIALYGEDGTACVLIDGFRAISVAGIRRDNLGGTRDVLYHLDWEMTPMVSKPAALKPVPLSRLREVAQAGLADVIAIRGEDRLKGAIAAQDDLAAALLCLGLREMGAEIGIDFTAETLRVAAQMRPVFEQLMLKLQGRGLLEKAGAGYRPTEAFAKAA